MGRACLPVGRDITQILGIEGIRNSRLTDWRAGGERQVVMFNACMVMLGIKPNIGVIN
jgi:hypothetical protein